ncbi:MAG: cytochrome c [Caldilineaceae bacterium]|nr:cytochrome c [Caldilineaceae bacterium]
MTKTRSNLSRRTAASLAASLAVLLLLLVPAGCGNGDDASASGDDAASDSVPAASDRSIVPTMPAARFDQPTPVTDMEEASKADQEQDEGESQPDLATGELIFNNRCAECHGEDAAGTDQASSLVGLSLSEDDFEDLIRTGGELGPEHLFGSTKVSPDGLSAVFAYLTSLE